MKFSQALSALIDEEHDRRLGYHRLPGEDAPTRDETALSSTNIRISASVMGELNALFSGRTVVLDFGTFYNCREYGMTVTVGGWTFAVYEHRNTDDICIEGCPTAEVKDHGPYGGDDKYDVLHYARYNEHYESARFLNAIVEHVLDHPDATRSNLKKVVSIEVSA